MAMAAKVSNERLGDDCRGMNRNDQHDGFKHRFTKLLFDPKVSQIERREKLLKWQKERRDDLVLKLRQIETDSFTDDDEEEESMESIEESQSRFPFKDRTKHSKKYYAFGAKIMKSEWLVERPEDLDGNWLGVFCPVGNRCLVFASKGKTRIISRRGNLVGTMRSELPGGSAIGNYDGPSKGTTILDCIWSETSGTFYVLDMMCWNTMLCTNFETECRITMMKTNIRDIPGLAERSTTNEFPFVPLDFFPSESLQRELGREEAPFSEQVDGLLLFHKESFYIYEGSNPLCLWIELPDVMDILQLEVNESLLSNSRHTNSEKLKELRANMTSMEDSLTELVG